MVSEEKAEFTEGGRGADRHQKHIFEHNSASNYLTMKKLHMGRLYLNTKKLFSTILEFSILRGGKGENAEY